MAFSLRLAKDQNRSCHFGNFFRESLQLKLALAGIRLYREKEEIQLMKRADLDRLLATVHGGEKALDHLDEREFEMFSLLAQGTPAFIISREMGVSGEELDSIKSQIRRKLRLKDDVQLRQYAAKHRP